MYNTLATVLGSEAEKRCSVAGYTRFEERGTVESNLIAQSLKIIGRGWSRENVRLESMSPDGSQRRFVRIIGPDQGCVVGIAPPMGDRDALAESASAWKIGSHLFAKQVPVPELYGYDAGTGLLVCEDLGDVRLHDMVLEHGFTHQVRNLYFQAVTELANMQIRVRIDFDPAWCWDTPRYDRALMLERESGYFLKAFCRDLLQMEVSEERIRRDFTALADRASQADSGYFLHRDFQSRNIMIKDGRIRIIDYQGGRLGPAGYDLASLFIDPYAALPLSLQAELLSCYLDCFSALVPISREQFKEEYLVLALQRNLQILGAFAWLSNRCDKPFFRRYIAPSLSSLQRLLAKTASEEYSYLKLIVNQCKSEMSTLAADIVNIV